MCGLIGAITKHRNGFSWKQLQVVETLLYLDTLRGEDSTGVFAINNMGNVGIAKDAITGEKFLATDEWKYLNQQSIQQGWAIIGHNRKATRGSVNAENAHPFWVEDKLVLVHNGSFRGSHKHLKDTDVDSHAIAHLLAEEGPDNIEGALKKVDAAYALIFYDVENKKLHFIRNPERPLHWVETKDCWYFASEMKMLDFALDRHGEEPLKAIYEFPEYSLNTWALTSDKTSELTSVVLDCKYKYVHNSGRTQVSDPFKGVGPWWEGRGNIACGYECDEVEEYNRELAEAMKRNHIVDTPKIVQVGTKPADSQVTVTVMPWMKRVTMGQWKLLKDNYKTGQKVKVIVDDYLDDDQATKQVMVSGKTLDTGTYPVVFKVGRETLDHLTSPKNVNLNEAVFEITVDYVGWRKIDNKEYKEMDDAEGIMIVNGKEGKLIFDGTGVGHA